MISEIAGKVKSINISEIVGFWKFNVLYLFSLDIFLLPLLCFIQGCLEFRVFLLTKSVLGLSIFFNIKKAVVVGLGEVKWAIAVFAI